MFLVVILLVGTIGYWIIGGRHDSFVNALYMTFITIATIGYGEVVDLSHSTGGRIFTMVIAVLGIGVLSYMMMGATALLVQGEVTRSFERRRMEKKAGRSRDHYIVCGTGRVGAYVAHELRSTARQFVVVDGGIDKNSAMPDSDIVIEGDATDNTVLEKAGIERASGVFAVTGDDNHNLVIALTAKQLNPETRVVAQCSDMKNMDKMKRAGADAVVSPDFIGGLRMASEMVRPAAVSFLDTMLRDREKNLRVEEIPVPDSFAGKQLSSLQLKKHETALLLAIKTGEDWVYAPRDDYVLRQGNVLVFMLTSEERIELEKDIRGK